MIDIANDNLDNELNIEKYMSKFTKYKNGKIVDLRTEEEIINERDFWRKSTKDKMFIIDNKEFNDNNEKEFMFNNKKYNPKELEYWRNVFPSKTDNELEEYRTRWSKDTPKYLKFERL